MWRMGIRRRFWICWVRVALKGKGDLELEVGLVQGNLRILWWVTQAVSAPLSNSGWVFDLCTCVVLWKMTNTMTPSVVLTPHP